MMFDHNEIFVSSQAYLTTCSGEYICNTSEIQTGWSPRSERPFQR